MQRSALGSPSYFTDINDVVDGLDSKMNSSFQTSAIGASANNASASSSKAVLAALRALQDKIRRLEVERSQALDEVSQLRQKLQANEIEFEHSKQREHLTIQKSMVETKHAYDRVLAEKAELEIRVGSQEERNRELKSTVKDLQDKLLGLDDERFKLHSKIKEQDSLKVHLQLQIEQIERKERDLAQTLLVKSKQHDESVGAMYKRFNLLEEELINFSREKAEAETKLAAADALVSQLLGLSGSLVARLTGKSSKYTTTKRRPLSAASAPVFASPRVAGLSTVSANMHKYEAAAARRPQATHVLLNSADVDELESLHKTYLARAAALREPSASASPKRKTSTRISRRKKSTSFAATPASFLSEQRTRDGSFHSSAPFSSSEKDVYSSRQGSVVDVHVPSTRFERQQPGSVSASFDLERSSNNTPAATDDLYGNRFFSAVDSRVGSSTGSITGRSFAVGGKSGGDLQRAISSLEGEFESLNEQYRRLLSSVQRTEISPAAGEGGNSGSSPGRRSAAEDLAATRQEMTYAEELVDVIRKLQQKGEQLRALKSPGGSA